MQHFVQHGHFQQPQSPQAHNAGTTQNVPPAAQNTNNTAAAGPTHNTTNHQKNPWSGKHGKWAAPSPNANMGGGSAAPAPKPAAKPAAKPKRPGAAPKPKPPNPKPARPVKKKPGLFRKVIGHVVGHALNGTGPLGNHLHRKIVGEDAMGGTPVNSASSGAVAGLGAPGSSEPGVPKKKKNSPIMSYQVFKRTKEST